MASFVLVHGGAHAAWCWDRLLPHLTADPRVTSVKAVDLCGHGDRHDAKPHDEIRIADYVDSVVTDIETADLQDVILVGHSMAGITLPHVAARVANRIRRVIYLSTTNPPLGKSVLDQMNEDALSPMSRGIDVTEGFCSDLDEETSTWLKGHLGVQPEGPMTDSVERVAGPPEIPSTYVVLDQDQILPPTYQLEQAARVGANEIVHFEAGHSAFASRPAELATLLLQYV
jgi:pimeloyl-ACP methyl ester carboxylesterase